MPLSAKRRNSGVTQAAIRRGRQTNKTNTPVVSDRTTGNRRSHRFIRSLLIQQHNNTTTTRASILHVLSLASFSYKAEGERTTAYKLTCVATQNIRISPVHGASSPDACTVGPCRLPWSSKARRCPQFTNHRHISAVVPAYLYDTFELWDRHRPRSEING